MFTRHDPSQTVHGLGQHRLFTDNGQQVLGGGFTALGPEPLPAAPGHDHNKTFEHAVNDNSGLAGVNGELEP